MAGQATRRQTPHVAAYARCGALVRALTGAFPARQYLKLGSSSPRPAKLPGLLGRPGSGLSAEAGDGGEDLQEGQLTPRRDVHLSPRGSLLPLFPAPPDAADAPPLSDRPLSDREGAGPSSGRATPELRRSVRAAAAAAAATPGTPDMGEQGWPLPLMHELRIGLGDLQPARPAQSRFSLAAPAAPDGRRPLPAAASVVPQEAAGGPAAGPPRPVGVGMLMGRFDGHSGRPAGVYVLELLPGGPAALSGLVQPASSARARTSPPPCARHRRPPCSGGLAPVRQAAIFEQHLACGQYGIFDHHEAL